MSKSDGSQPDKPSESVTCPRDRGGCEWPQCDCGVGRMPDRRQMAQPVAPSAGVAIDADQRRILERVIATWETHADEQSATYHEAQALRRLLVAPSASVATFTLPPLDDDEDLGDILGRPCFTCITIAELLRFDGYAIKQRAEDEQAQVIHWLLGLWLTYGKEWRAAATEHLKAINAKRTARADERATVGPTATGGEHG